MNFMILFCLFLHIVISTQKSPGPPRSIDPDHRPIPKSVFTVVAPTVIRQEKPFDVHIRGFNIQESVYLTIRITGTSDDGVKLKLKKYATISRSKSKKSVSFDTSAIASGAYTLIVETDDGFEEKRTLTYFKKKFSFFVQFNKAIFMPGDLLQFRIFSVDSETKPINPTSATTITISDSNGNAIQSFQDVKFKRGKYENIFQLSEKARLGIWKVLIQCDLESKVKVFEVAEYILPLLDAKLTVAPVTPVMNGKVPITVDVSYTSGGEASGKATVTIENDDEPKSLTKTINISFGTATFDLDIEKDLNVPAGKNSYFQANLVFEDPLTGMRVTDFKRFNVAYYAYRFFPKLLTPMKPGSDLKFTITMKHVDGKPAPVGTKIYLRPETSSTLPPQNLTIGEDGSVSSSYYIAENTTSLTVAIIADNAIERNLIARLPYYEIGEYCRIEVMTEIPKINEPVQLKIRTGYQVDFVMVHVVSKGILLKSSKVYFDDDSNEDNDLTTVVYKINPSFKNSPSTKIIAYYINSNGDFVVGKTIIMFENDLPNYLQISPATQDVKPGEEISLNIESKVGSRVYLAAIDQRLLMLREGADITKNAVLSELEEYTYNKVEYDFNNLAEYEYNFGKYGLFVFTNIPRPKRKFARSMRRPERGSAPTKSGPGGRDVKIRKDFRETFLWREVSIYDSANDYDDESKGIATITETVPESITTYLIYGVSMSKYEGMGLFDNIPTVSVFLPFFLSVDFPYSLKRNEVLIQDILIFNYLKKSQTVDLRITRNGGYKPVDLQKHGWKETKSFYVKSITTKVGQNIKLQFAFKSESLGFVTIEIAAKGPLAGDGLKKQLRIIPEGIPRSITSSVFIALDSKDSEFKTILSCNLPDSAYQDTTSVSATVVGDFFGKALTNLDKLISMPGGCGEQTMLSLAPDIAIYEYLSASDKLTPELKIKLESYIHSGYQNELRYQRRDGSFSAFGKNDPAGSTWLTAYVIEYFYLARNMIPIDKNIIEKGADFVIGNQNVDGSFKEPGHVIHSDMQGGSGAGIGLTAYCVIMLTMLLPDYPNYKNARNKAVKYLENNYSSGTTLYEMGIIAYALKVADSKKATSAYNMFESQKTETATLLFWATSNNQQTSLNIEITSYGLLTTIRRDESSLSILKIVKYLVSQANNLGGYSSSQDTVMAFYALSQFARTFSLDANVELTMTPNAGDELTATIDSTNTFTLQSFDLYSSTRTMKVVATTEDSGLAIVSLVCNFYEDPTKVVPVFNVTYNFGLTCTHTITMNACASYIPKGKSNMAIMIVTLPSGFIFNEWEKQKNSDISRTEFTNQGTLATFYFNSISNTQTCVTVNAFRANFVAELKGATIEVYDYYDTSKQGMTSYPAPDLSGKCVYYR